MTQTQRKDVRLRVPDHSQVKMQISSADELVGPDHSVRRIRAVVGPLDLSRFHEPIAARQGVPGRDSTDPKLLIALWLYAAARGSEFEPMPRDSDAVKRWRERMGGEEGKEIHKQRAATSETVNADVKTHRGLVQLSVRGLAKAQCVALWSALAYNLMHFGGHLIG